MRVSLLRCSPSFRPSIQGLRPGLTYAAPPALGRREGRVLSREVTTLAALAALTAGLCLAYNYARWGNALEFVNGPYSAHAIQQQTRTSTMPSYPGENSPRTAALYFLNLTRLNLGQGFAEHLLLTIAVVALLSSLYFSRQFLPCALLWTPVLFYVLCIAWGRVPIYFPDSRPSRSYRLAGRVCGRFTLPTALALVCGRRATGPTRRRGCASAAWRRITSSQSRVAAWIEQFVARPSASSRLSQ